MQINSYQSIQVSPANQPDTHVSPADNPQPLASEPSVQVSISAQALQLAKSENIPYPHVYVQPESLPSESKPSLTGDKLEQAVQFKKAQLHYQAISDMANLLTGNSKDISVSGAYYLSNNEDARELVLQTTAQQQNMRNMQTYLQQTAALNEQYA